MLQLYVSNRYFGLVYKILQVENKLGILKALLYSKVATVIRCSLLSDLFCFILFFKISVSAVNVWYCVLVDWQSGKY